MDLAKYPVYPVYLVARRLRGLRKVKDAARSACIGCIYQVFSVRRREGFPELKTGDFGRETLPAAPPAASIAAVSAERP